MADETATPEIATSEALAGLTEQLQTISEQIAEHAIAMLREAINTRDDDRRSVLRARERQLTRARRAVEKAAGLLDGAGTDEMDDM